MKLPVSILGAIIQMWKKHNFTKNQPQPGAPSKISDREKRIIRRVVQDPRTTCRKLQKDLESAGPIISKKTGKPPGCHHARFTF